MADVFAGAADGRQSTKLDEPTSRFRPRYRALTDAEKALHDEIKAKASELEALFEQVSAMNRMRAWPGIPYAAPGMLALEEAVMWKVKELTS